MPTIESTATPIVQWERDSAVSRAIVSHSPGSYWFDAALVVGIRSTPHGKRATWCSVHRSSRCTTATASTMPAAHAMYQPKRTRVQKYPISDSTSAGTIAHSQMRASVALVGSCHVVHSPFLHPFHWMTCGRSCASVDAINEEKKSGIAMNDAIAHGPLPRDFGTRVGYPNRRESGGV